jgi:integrase
MAQATLMGSHSHATLSGITVHVWERGGTYLARGRYQGQPFGETLGEDPLQAAARLRDILTKLDNGTYVRPSDRRHQLVSSNRVARLTLRELVADFLRDKRRSRGRQTAGDYAARLAPVLNFAEKSDSLKRWPLALDIDAEFARALRVFLFQYRSTRNGRPGGNPRPLSLRQIVNVLECLRTMLHWARRPQVRKLPPDWVSPLTADLIGLPPAKDPLRQDKLPLRIRAAVVTTMDGWQLCQLALSLVLPLRPDEAAGLIVSDVNFEKGWLEFGARFQDCNFTKARTAFVLPFPPELLTVLLACVAGRAEGPLLRDRRAFERGVAKAVDSAEHLRRLYEAELSRQPADAVQTEQDRKVVFRRLLRRLGGVSEGALGREFKDLLTSAGVKNEGTSLYSLRHAMTTEMNRAGVPHLELRYLTGHSAADILNAYTTLDPVGAMRRYFDTIRPLLDAITSHAERLGLV